MSNLIFVALSLYMMVQGIFGLATGKILGSNDAKRKQYDAETYAKFVKIISWSYVVCGLSAAIYEVIWYFLPDQHNLVFIPLAVMVIALVVMIVANTKLSKKNGKKSKDDVYVDED